MWKLGLDVGRRGLERRLGKPWQAKGEARASARRRLQARWKLCALWKLSRRDSTTPGARGDSPLTTAAAGLEAHVSRLALASLARNQSFRALMASLGVLWMPASSSTFSKRSSEEAKLEDVAHLAVL